MALALACAAAGCSDPYADAPAEPTRSAVAEAITTPQPPRPDVGDAAPAAPVGAASPPIGPGARRSPATLARAYARRSINWDWSHLADNLATLRGLATQPLMAELDRTAASIAVDESLRRDRSGSRGRVLAVAVNGHGGSRRVVVVTREQELQRGHATLEGERARVYTGEMRLTADGWRMRRWEREP